MKKDNKMRKKYDNDLYFEENTFIYDKGRHKSTKRKKTADSAVQFFPFAALGEPDELINNGDPEK